MTLKVLATSWRPHWYNYIPFIKNRPVVVLSENSLHPRFSFEADGVQIKVIRSNYIPVKEIKNVSIINHSLIFKSAYRLEIATMDKGTFHVVFHQNHRYLKEVRDEFSRLGVSIEADL